jgi:phytoene dehydrogenase-like protein
MKQYDAIIVGGGHNGLVCAAYLARAGRRVLVLERRDRIGGAAVTEEVFPGFRFSVFSYVVSLLRPEIIRELELPRHGLHVLPLESTLTPLPNGDYLAQWNDHDQNRRELARHSLRDAESYDDYGRRMHHMARAGEAAAGDGAAGPGFAPSARPAGTREPGRAICAAWGASGSTSCAA